MTTLNAQQLFHQDVFYGGVTGAGFSTGMGSGSGSFDIYIEPGSTVKKAYAFTYSIGFPPQANFILNGDNIVFDTTNRLMDVSHTSPYATPIRLYFKDVTSFINPAITNYNITIPSQLGLPINWGYWTFFLYVIYDNPTFSTSNATIIINKQDFTGNEYYDINNLNPIDSSWPVGFSIYSDRSMDGNPPDKNVFFNHNSLGIIGGSDNINNSWNYAGVKGHFYYQNNQLFGLDDDTPTALMDGTDGLADVSSYIPNNSTDCDFQFLKINYPTQPHNETHNNLAYFLTYTTPCDTFSTTVTQDTTICYGETLQLQATGGQSYAWTALTDSSAIDDLSCTDCPNPTFSGTKSQVYTVRIWNTDSCSVVKPVRIAVSQPQKMSFVGSNTSCTSFTGKINALSDTSLYSNWFAITTNGDTLTTTSNALNNIGAGEYTVFHTNKTGCTMQDTVLRIGLQNNTVADFSVQPPSGTVPFQVDIGNLSQNATDFQWQLNGIDQGSSFTGFTADKAGVYVVQLIAWSGLPECADTVERFVVAYSNGDILISEAFSPNDDAKNEVFYIEGLENFPNTKVWIYNRWGNLVFHSENYQNDWNGTSQSSFNIGGSKLPEGTYYYVIKLGGDLILEEDNSVKTGFVVLRR